jgi:hypothetical protein
MSSTELHMSLKFGVIIDRQGELQVEKELNNLRMRREQHRKYQDDLESEVAAGIKPSFKHTEQAYFRGRPSKNKMTSCNTAEDLQAQNRH